MKVIKSPGKVILGIAIVMIALFALFYLLTMGEYPVPETVTQDP